MTTNRRTAAQPRAGWGDAAVDGLLAGIGAGFVMAGFLVAAGLFAGLGWQAVLAQFDPAPAPTPLNGALTHLAVAGVYGVVFGVVGRFLSTVWQRLPLLLAGLGFGLILWGLAATVAGLPSPGTAGWLRATPPVWLALAHAVYGLSLAGLLRRKQLA